MGRRKDYIPLRDGDFFNFQRNLVSMVAAHNLAWANLKRPKNSGPWSDVQTIFINCAKNFKTIYVRKAIERDHSFSNAKIRALKIKNRLSKESGE